MILIILSLTWIFFSALEGKRDASFYHANMTSSNPVKENIHWVFSVTRGIVWSLIIIITLYEYPNQITFSDLWDLLPSLPILSTVFAVSLTLIFSFVHNGMYYFTRNRIDSNIYPKGFWDASVSSTATIELSAKTRTIMAVIGGLGVITTLLM